MDETGAPAYIGQEASSTDYGGSGENSGYVDPSFLDSGETEASSGYEISRRGHGRPSDEEIQKMISQSRKEQESRGTPRQKSSHARPSDKDLGQMGPSRKEIEHMKMAQKQAYRSQSTTAPQSSHARPSDYTLIRGMYGTNGGTEDVSQDDKSFVTKYFPGASDVYQYDDNGSIISATDVSFSERRNVKKAICGHWYFFTFGCVSNEPQSKRLSEKLAKIKSDLNLANHIIRKAEEKWHK